MNKYLLLRDNKQSGPYTVAEIKEIGIKPYDLVWLEGKSAAWRYPSEIPELQSFAPSVEEQPFDRFYKTREAILSYQGPESPVPAPTPSVELEHSPYEPKIAEQLAPEEELPRKKVYINFPANKPEVKTQKSAPLKQPLPLKETPFIPAPVHDYNVTSHAAYSAPSEKLSMSNTKNRSDQKLVIYAAAACLVLLGFIALLMINNSGQKKRLHELNTIVKDIQHKNNTAGIGVTQVKNVEPAPQPGETSETIINPELLKLSETEAPAQKAVVAVVPTAPKPVPAKPAGEVMAGNENKDAGGRPVMRRSDNNATTTTSLPNNTKSTETESAATENLFKQINIQPGKYKVGMLGGISNLTFSLTNNSKRELHKVAVQVKYLGPEKKVVNTQTIYFENVAPGQQSTIEVPKSKRGVSVDYTITDVKS